MLRKKALHFALVGGALTAAIIAACQSDPGSNSGCTGGICVDTDGSVGSGDMRSSVCVENWVCSPWTTTSGNAGTRTCVDKNGCNTTAQKPALTATLPALDQNYFRCNVVPILDQKCAQLACHGTETERGLRVYARGRHRNSETVTFTGCLQTNVQVPLVPNCIGSIECACAAVRLTATENQKNFDSARAFGLDATTLQPIPKGSEQNSELLAQPVVGGKAHAGIHLFQSTDADYMTIKNWLGGATLATCAPAYN